MIVQRLRSVLTAAGAAATAVAMACVLPASAAASQVELGQTSTPLVAPTCPADVSQNDCKIVLPEVTALETVSSGTKSPTRVTKAGELVAFTVGISAISSSAKTVNTDVKYLDSTYGGPPEVRITVLRPVGKRSDEVWEVAAQSQNFALRDYFGRVVQFPLTGGLPVTAGEEVALTAPTWAPVLDFGLSKTAFDYRQSRRANCGNPPSSLQAELKIGAHTHYGCSYAGTRVEYTATEITSPTPNK